MSASVFVDLDIEAPVLSVTAVPQVDPPTPWEVLVESDKEIGSALAALSGEESLLGIGIEHVDPYRLRVLVPTASFGGGESSLLLRVTDTVSNLVQISVPVVINREDGFRVGLSIGRAYDAGSITNSAFNSSAEIFQAYSTSLEVF